MLTRVFTKRILASAFLAGSLVAGVASANGRYPSAQLLVLDPSDPNRLWLRATYGLFTSADRGCTWHRICETAPDYLGTEDPMFGVLADGTVIGATFHGPTTTRDHGYSWSTAGPMDDRYVVDLAVQPTDAQRALAMVSAGKADGGFDNQVWRTADSAKNWTQLEQDLDQDLLLLTLDAAPSLPSRIYVTAVRTTVSDAGAPVRQGVLVRSDDDGATWKSDLIAGSVDGFEPYLSAIHASDPDKLYVRLRGPDSAPDLVENRVVYSADGGKNWQQIFQARADILGFALAPDGSRVLLGLGDSRDLNRARPVDPDALGIYAASAQDHKFARTRPGHTGCLTWSPDGVYFCASEYPIDKSPGFELGLTTDEGATSKQVMHRSSIEGPLVCPAGSSTAMLCDDEEWIPICKDLGRCDFDSGNYLPYPRGETCSAGAGGTDAGSGGTGGGYIGSGGTSDAGSTGGNPGAGGSSASGGCGCGTVTSSRASLTAGLLLALATLGAWSRQRKRC